MRSVRNTTTEEEAARRSSTAPAFRRLGDNARYDHSLKIAFIGAESVKVLNEAIEPGCYESSAHGVVRLNTCAFPHSQYVYYRAIDSKARSHRIAQEFGEEYLGIYRSNVYVFTFDPTERGSLEEIEFEVSNQACFYALSNDLQVLVSCISPENRGKSLVVTREEIEACVKRIMPSNPNFESQVFEVDLNNSAGVKKFFDQLVSRYVVHYAAGNGMRQLVNLVRLFEKSKEERQSNLARKNRIYRDKKGYTRERLLFDYSSNAVGYMHRPGALPEPKADRIFKKIGPKVSEEKLSEFLRIVQGLCSDGPLTREILKEINRAVCLIEDSRESSGMTLKLARGKWQSIWRKINELVINNFKEKVRNPPVINYAGTLEFIEDFYTIEREWGFFAKRVNNKKYFDICKKLGKINRLELENQLSVVGEWRPSLHSKFPTSFRAAVRTLHFLARAETSSEAEDNSCTL